MSTGEEGRTAVVRHLLRTYVSVTTTRRRPATDRCAGGSRPETNGDWSGRCPQCCPAPLVPSHSSNNLLLRYEVLLNYGRHTALSLSIYKRTRAAVGKQFSIKRVLGALIRSSRTLKVGPSVPLFAFVPPSKWAPRLISSFSPPPADVHQKPS